VYTSRSANPISQQLKHSLEKITRRTGLQLRAWDAAHLIHAVTWSRDLGAPVTLVTADKSLDRVLAALPEFERFVEVLDPGV
jgi:hypothetical protein